MKHIGLLKSKRLNFIFIAFAFAFLILSCNKDDIMKGADPNSILGVYIGKVFSDNKARSANSEIIVSNLRSNYVDCNFKFIDTNTEVKVDCLLITNSNSFLIVKKNQENEFTLEGRYFNDSLNITFKDLRFGSDLVFETKRK